MSIVDEMNANAAAVHNRLWPSKGVNVAQSNSEAMRRKYEEMRDKLASSQRELEELKAIVARQATEIETLTMDKADLEAALLCQAHMMVDAFRVYALEHGKPVSRSPREIIEGVLEREFPNFSFSDIVGRKQGNAVVAARHRCMQAVYNERTDLTTTLIGRVFNRDRTTVIHAAVKKEGVNRGGTAKNDKGLF